MSVSKGRLSEYNALPASARRWVLRMLRSWAGWSRTTVYRKLECSTLCRLEELLVSGCLKAAHNPQSDGQQLLISFDWSDGEGKMDVRSGD